MHTKCQKLIDDIELKEELEEELLIDEEAVVIKCVEWGGSD